MRNILVYPIGSTNACRFAASFLHKEGIPLVDHPSPEITHLLLDVPSFGPDGTLRGGGLLPPLLDMLPPDITVIGGNLNHPALAEYCTIDLLQDAEYLAVNAAITADCALQTAAPLLQTTFRDTPILIIGWGRIGKCLARLLKSIDADVTVAARKETDRAALRSLGYKAVELNASLAKYRLIFNTAPEPVFVDQITRHNNCIKIDLASNQGLMGDDVVWARGLPGIYAPESSGRLITDTILHLIKEEL